MNLISYWEISIWPHFPQTITWLQLERDARLSKTKLFRKERHYKGINASIIVLSAACIDGFLSDCLQTFAGGKFTRNDTFVNRLDNEFLRRAKRATFKESKDLFALALGKPLDELISNEDIRNGVNALFNFRNGVAHARSESFETYDDNEQEQEWQVTGQYEQLNKYLKSKHLIGNAEHLFQNAIVDHFAALVKPYIQSVLLILPKESVKKMDREVRFAFSDIAELQKQYTKT